MVLMLTAKRSAPVFFKMLGPVSCTEVPSTCDLCDHEPIRIATSEAAGIFAKKSFFYYFSPAGIIALF